MLKDYLSPDIWREYGPRETEQRGEPTANGQGEEACGQPKDNPETEPVLVPPVTTS